jgi:hypothetical protein
MNYPNMPQMFLLLIIIITPWEQQNTAQQFIPFYFQNLLHFFAINV